MYEKILVPVSLSNLEDNVVRHAVEHSLNHDSELHAVHVVADDILERMENDDTVEPRNLGSKTSREVLSDVKKKVPEDVEFVSKELAGSPSSSIVRYANKNDIDIIVMGTHGRSGVERYLLGSVAEEVVRNSSCPVLTVELSGE